jgi:PhnB protein
MLGPQGEEHWTIFSYERIGSLKSFTALTAFSDAEGILSDQMPSAHWKVTFTDKG